MDSETATLLASLPPREQDRLLEALRVRSAGAPAGSALDAAARSWFENEVRRIAGQHAPTPKPEAVPSVVLAGRARPAASTTSTATAATSAATRAYAEATLAERRRLQAEPWAALDPLPEDLDEAVRALSRRMAEVARERGAEAASSIYRRGLAQLWERAAARSTFATFGELTAFAEFKLSAGVVPRR